jgi:peptidoglycan-associated lipoprotein
MPRTLLFLLLTAGFVGCASRAANSPTPNAGPQPASPARETPRQDASSHPASGEDTDSLAALTAAPLYFGLDSATLAPEARGELERLAQALRQRSLAKVTVSGHTCELGTTEYNIALGQRRADIVRSYLVRLGVEPQRISVVSYGEERPADVNAPEKNRRAELSFRLAEQARAGEL